MKICDRCKDKVNGKPLWSIDINLLCPDCKKIIHNTRTSFINESNSKIETPKFIKEFNKKFKNDK